MCPFLLEVLHGEKQNGCFFTSGASFHLTMPEVCCCTLSSVRALKASPEAVDKKWSKADPASTAPVVRSVCWGSLSKDAVEIVQGDRFS